MEASEKPCCKLHKQLNAKMKTYIRVFKHLLGGNPRHWVMFYENLKASGMTASEISFGLKKVCPCKYGMDVVIIDKKEV